ncbi:MAG: PrsW family intramembrane metalloprotease [Chloroflexia bacterium]|nr:PrsW family intramembrane metalloprotease [Chloroflexia bacterium]
MKRIWKRLLSWAGLVLLVLGLPGMLWMLWDSLFWSADIGLVLGLFLAAAGALLFHHARRSLLGRPSSPLRLPPLWLLAGLFALLLAGVLGGSAWRFLAADSTVFLPLLAGLPPLLAVAWAVDGAAEGLTWRRFLIVLALGATASVLLAVILEALLPAALLALVAGLFELARAAWERAVEALAGGEVAQVLGSYFFLWGWIELAVVSPLAEEFAKPLLLLPLLRSGGRRPAFNPRHAFLLGAVVGAGFATTENMLYMGLGYGSFWHEFGPGIALVRAMGAAIHPLASGLVAWGWYRLFYPADPVGPGESPLRRFLERRPWLSRFGLAVLVHAVWNGGGLLVLGLAGGRFFGGAPEVDVFGTTLLGVLLALLALLAAAAWMALRMLSRDLLARPAGEAADGELPRWQAGLLGTTDRALAFWALLCLAVALPMGLAALRLLGLGN